MATSRGQFVYYAPMTVWLFPMSLLRTTIYAAYTPPLLQIVGRRLQPILHRFKSHRLLYSHSRMVQRLVQTVFGHNTLKIFLLARPTTVNCCMVAVTDLTNLLLEGKTPSYVRGSLFGANLLAIRKNNGGIRPIAVGYVWRRLTAKVACSHAREVSITLLAPSRQMDPEFPKE